MEKDPKVYGVIADIETNDNFRTYNTGKWYYNHKKEDGHRIRLNSVGEGAIMVSSYKNELEEYDEIENGSYICSSPITGIGMKQDDDLLHNYTVAKATCSVDFSNSNSPFYYTNFKIDMRNIMEKHILLFLLVALIIVPEIVD